jgi:hypothetical protein
MATNIQALERGGYSAYGQAWTDDRCRIVYLQTEEDEAHPITVTFPSAISTVTEAEGGAMSSTPAISESSFTATLTGLSDGYRLEYLVTLTSGEARRLRIMGAPRYDVESRDYAG